MWMKHWALDSSCESMHVLGYFGGKDALTGNSLNKEAELNAVF